MPIIGDTNINNMGVRRNTIVGPDPNMTSDNQGDINSQMTAQQKLQQQQQLQDNERFTNTLSEENANNAASNARTNTAYDYQLKDSYAKPDVMGLGTGNGLTQTQSTNMLGAYDGVKADMADTRGRIAGQADNGDLSPEEESGIITGAKGAQMRAGAATAQQAYQQNAATGGANPLAAAAIESRAGGNAAAAGADARTGVTMSEAQARERGRGALASYTGQEQQLAGSMASIYGQTRDQPGEIGAQATTDAWMKSRRQQGNLPGATATPGTTPTGGAGAGRMVNGQSVDSAKYAAHPGLYH